MMDSARTMPFTIKIDRGSGEDAPPLLLETHESMVIAVFDGLGGAGGHLVTDRNGESNTSAYHASRLASKCAKDFFERIQPNSDASTAAEARSLERSLADAFMDRTEFSSVPGSRVRGSLIKQLPTTMAAIRVRQLTDRKLICRVYWVGDSRAYLLTPTFGLQQLTTDDIRTPGDAWDNLYDQSPMSNIINSSGHFEVHSHTLEVDEPAVFLVATDGCFGYVSTPPLFEALLLETLIHSNSKAEWQKALCRQITRITQDDATLALVAIGWGDVYIDMQASFQERYLALKGQCNSSVASAGGPVRPLNPDAGKEWWSRYKCNYELRVTTLEERAAK